MLIALIVMFVHGVSGGDVNGGDGGNGDGFGGGGDGGGSVQKFGGDGGGGFPETAWHESNNLMRAADPLSLIHI